MAELRGFLDRWNDEKGFGFIYHLDYPKGVFVHISAFSRDISRRPIVGDMICYELFVGADGKSKAVNARIEGVSPVTRNWRKIKNYSYQPVDIDAGNKAVNARIEGEAAVTKNSRKTKQYSFRLADLDDENKAVNFQIKDTQLLTKKNYNNRRDSYRKSSPVRSVVALIILIVLAVLAFNKYQAIREIKYTAPVPTAIKESFFTPIAEPPQSQYSCQGKTYCSQMSSCEEAQFYQRHCSGTKMDGDGDGIPCEDQWCGH